MTMELTAQTTTQMHTSTGAFETPWRWPLPAGTLLAVFEERSAAYAAASDLKAGDMPHRGTVAYGTLLAGEVKAGLGRQWLGNERDITGQLAAALSSGRTVLLVPPGPRGALDVLESRGPASIYRVGRWTTEHLLPRRTRSPAV